MLYLKELHQYAISPVFTSADANPPLPTHPIMPPLLFLSSCSPDFVLPNVTVRGTLLTKAKRSGRTLIKKELQNRQWAARPFGWLVGHDDVQ